jgi:hypothetical protein
MINAHHGTPHKRAELRAPSKYCGIGPDRIANVAVVVGSGARALVAYYSGGVRFVIKKNEPNAYRGRAWLQNVFLGEEGACAV